MNEIPIDKDIADAYYDLKKTVRIGSQYEWLAQVSKWYPGVEVSVEKPIDSFGGCSESIKKFGELIIDNGVGRINKEKSQSSLNMIMGDFTFPIITLTEPEMVKKIHEWGYEDIVKNIWFCHTPINDKPCGCCRPCQQKMEDRMEFLLDEGGRRRYKVFSTMKKIVGEKYVYKFTKAIRLIR